MDFRQFLEEKKETHVVLAFGRMNPPTIGHEKLVNKVKEIAKKVGGTPYIVLSHSQDSAKNPLTPEQKLKHAKRCFPGVKLSVSDKQHPNFLSQASLLYKNGATHLHMVAGADRIDEYDTILNKYNGVKGTHGYFKFKQIEVHSAGERDPDAEGVEGMSASKMREAAAKANFKQFKKGVPSNASNDDAKDLYNDVRKGMNIKENFDSIIQNILSEGVHDKGIFKAMFLAGGPGSGKDYVLNKTLAGHGLIEINSDKALEFLMDKNNLDKKMPENEKEARNLIRGKAKDITDLRERLALIGRNGLIVNGTGDDHKKIERIKKRLEELGYETGMIMVNTRDEVSQQRNIERGQRGGRTVPEDIRKEKWNSVQAARSELAKLFGSRYYEFDNSEDLRNADPDIVKSKNEEMTQLFRNVQDFVKKPTKSDVAKEWISQELSKKDTLPMPKGGIEQVAPQNSGAAEEARKLGLQYYGFGRYGRNGKVTHHSIHDQLIADPVKENIDNEFESLLSEAITVSITADTTEELNSAFRLLTGNGSKEEVEEHVRLSNDNAVKMLTLGKSVPVLESYSGTKTTKEKDGNTYVALGGKPRVYTLRNMAAKDAHRLEGEVVKVEKGYMVKLKENENVEIFQRLIEETDQANGDTSTGWSNEKSYSSTRDTNTSTTITECAGETDCSCEENRTEKTKIEKAKYLSKIKEGFKIKKYQE